LDELDGDAERLSLGLLDELEQPTVPKTTTADTIKVKDILTNLYEDL
jgi:hypothetical protein